MGSSTVVYFSVSHAMHTKAQIFPKVAQRTMVYASEHSRFLHQTSFKELFLRLFPFHSILARYFVAHFLQAAHLFRSEAHESPENSCALPHTHTNYTLLSIASFPSVVEHSKDHFNSNSNQWIGLFALI